jgi:nitrite reductase/ring-hydroxylating ferredoxin subunit
MENWVKTASVKDFDTVDRKTFQHFTIFKDGETYFACQNRCPHMGYPMNKGTIRQGVITCAWHNWEFDTHSGGCYRGACEDIKIYPVKIEGEDLFVDKSTSETKHKDLNLRLQEAMRSTDIYQQAKVLNQMIAEEVSIEDITETALLHGFHHSERNHQSELAVYETQAIMDAFLISAFFTSKEKPTVLLQGIRTASGSTGDRIHMTPLPGDSISEDRSMEMLEKYTKDFSPLGLERVLLTITKKQPFQLLASNLLNLATKNYFIGQREVLIAIAALIRQCNVLSTTNLDNALIAQTAWVLGQTRQEPDIETREAIAWLDNHHDLFDHSLDSNLSDRVNTSASLEEILQENSIQKIFDGLSKLLQSNISELDLLNGFSLLSARRFSRLWLNNGGMWNSASEGIRYCYAIRTVWNITGFHQRRSLFALAFYYFQSRWLQNGTPWKTKSQPDLLDKLSKRYADAFESLNEPDAKTFALALAEGKHTELNSFALDFCKPLLEEDLDPVQLNTLVAVLHEQQHQKEWQPYIAGMITYSVDKKLEQNLKAAGKFGKGYFNNEE